MAIKLLSWNIEGRLTRYAAAAERGSPEHIIAQLRHHDADIVVLPEASDGKNIEPSVYASLEQLGYRICHVEYNDAGERPFVASEQPSLMLLSRLALSDIRSIRPGGVRTLLTAVMTEPSSNQKIRIIPIHLDERSERNRLLQAEAVADLASKSEYPIILAGDFNAMHARDPKAKLARFLCHPFLSRWMPHSELRVRMQQVYEMAEGRALGHCMQVGLYETNPHFRATTTPQLRTLPRWMPNIRLIQIDHILLSRDLRSEGFTIAPDGGSDHRALSVNIYS